MSKKTPTSPARAHHRTMREILSGIDKKKDPTPDELDRISKVFAKMGGSWEQLFKGSAEDVVLLKRILRIVAKKGLVGDKSDWT